MKEPAKFTVFSTKWGYFALAGMASAGISAAVLPHSDKKQAESRIREKSAAQIPDESLFLILKSQIQQYFEGEFTDFSDVKVNLTGISNFQEDVLTAARKIESGQTVSYKELAEMANHPNASRAVGTALSKNPIPLIIPCHRIIRSDGTTGEFSSGAEMKKKLLEHEKKVILLCKQNKKY
jgi:O-6-methylguanine DNA methyltransferase